MERRAGPAAIRRPPSFGAGRPITSQQSSATPRYLARRGSRFILFSAIGGGVFLAGFGLQAVLTSSWHVRPVVSYLIQAIVSVEASFLLNRWLTWRDRGTPFWLAYARFNTQKAVTIALNLALYAGLLRLGVNYLIANVVLTAVFTVVNYVAGDRLVFIPGRTPPASSAAPAALARVGPSARVGPRLKPGVSVVVPCRDNERTIRAAVQSLLDQDYPRLDEIVLVGSPGERTWGGLAGLADPRLTIVEVETPPGLRDANYKRDAGVKKTTGDLIALMDSDIVLPPDWMRLAVAALEDSRASCVAGGMKSVHDTFWGRYADSTWIGAKTPRIAESYTVTSADFGMQGRKPPITANTLFTRELYDRCPIDPWWSHGSYEDYEWFWRVTQAGYGIRVCRDLFGWHHHRHGLRAVAREYRRSSRGCAYFIRAHKDSPFARRRLRQAVTLPLAAIAGITAAAAVAADGYSVMVAGVALGCAVLIAVHQIVRSRRLESLAYPVAGLALGVVFTTGLVTNLIRLGPTAAGSPVALSPPPASEAPQAPQATQQRRRRSWRHILHPLTAILAVQAGLSLALVWSNTAFGDEADYLWVGHLLIAHWLHGTPWPSAYADGTLSGSPVIYPPLGALADSIGGLAGARVLSLVFMLGATVLLYLTASRLVGRTGAAFAAALWAISEPAVRLAFATYDPLSVFLTALSAWLAVQAGYRRRRGEFVAASAAALALANATAYSGLVIDPVLIAFAFLVWLPRMRAQQASFATAWLAGAWMLFFGLFMTAGHSWAGIISTVVSRSGSDHQSILIVLNDIWGYSGLIISLAVIGAAVAISADNIYRACLLVLLACTAFLVPAAQLHDQTAWSLDKHLAYGIWFAAIAAGYAGSKLIQWLPGASRQLAVLCCVVALVYPVTVSWELAWERYHAWPDAASFVTSFKPIAAHSSGLIYTAGQNHVAEYYTPQGREWQRWSGALSLGPGTVRQSAWGSYYAAQLRSGHYGVIALFYPTTFSSVNLPGSMLLSPGGRGNYQKLLDLVGTNSGEPGLSALTQALEKSPDYRLAAAGPYDTSNISGTHDYSVYVIWQRKARA